MVLSPGAGRASAARVQPPFRHHRGRDSQCRAGSAPGCLCGRFCKRRLRFRRGDARGEAPCIRKLKISPSRREGGWGDGGKKKAKGRGGRRQRRQAPPSGTTVAGIASAARVQPPCGCRIGRANQYRPVSAPPPGTATAGTISTAGSLLFNYRSGASDASRRQRDGGIQACGG